jgi:hypothetical protein
VKAEGHTDGNRPVNAKAPAATAIAKRDAESRAFHVMVRPGDEAKPVSSNMRGGYQVRISCRRRRLGLEERDK